MTNPPQPLPQSAFVSTHRVLNVTIIVAIIMVIVGALGWEVLRVTTPPELVVSTPIDNLLTTEHSTVLEGRATPESIVTINDTSVSLNTDGTFRETLDLRTGLNIITISASKKFSKSHIIYRRVVVSNP